MNGSFDVAGQEVVAEGKHAQKSDNAPDRMSSETEAEEVGKEMRTLRGGDPHKTEDKAQSLSSSSSAAAAAAVAAGGSNPSERAGLRSACKASLGFEIVMVSFNAANEQQLLVLTVHFGVFTSFAKQVHVCIWLPRAKAWAGTGATSAAFFAVTAVVETKIFF